jgi:hypothetical protein
VRALFSLEKIHALILDRSHKWILIPYEGRRKVMGGGWNIYWKTDIVL